METAIVIHDPLIVREPSRVVHFQYYVLEIHKKSSLLLLLITQDQPGSPGQLCVCVLFFQFLWNNQPSKCRQGQAVFGYSCLRSTQVCKFWGSHRAWNIICFPCQGCHFSFNFKSSNRRGFVKKINRVTAAKDGNPDYFSFKKLLENLCLLMIAGGLRILLLEVL